MTIRQKLLKTAYPALMFFNSKAGKNRMVLVNNSATPASSIYTLTGVLNTGATINLELFRGKKILFINTASDCGYTNQYEDLEKLYRANKDKLIILAFPSNDFKNQEQADDKEISSFCKLHYGTSFLLMQKSSVVKGPSQNELFQWLTDKNKNGWNNQQPTWNFSKYLINETGQLTHFFEAGVSPGGEEILSAIN